MRVEPIMIVEINRKYDDFHFCGAFVVVVAAVVEPKEALAVR